LFIQNSNYNSNIHIFILTSVRIHGMTILVDLHAFAHKHKTGKHIYTQNLLQQLSEEKNSPELILAITQETLLDFDIPKHWKILYLPSGLRFYYKFIRYANNPKVD